MMRSHLPAFMLFLGLLMLGLLVGPRVADKDQIEQCVVNVDLPGPFGVSLNCDSPEFMRLANTPAALLEPNNTRTSRPAMILVASGIAAMVAPLVPSPGSLGVASSRKDIDPSRAASAMQTMGPAYAAYLFLNLAILGSAFLLMRHLMVAAAGLQWNGAQVTPANQLLLFAGFGLLLVTNDVVKAFVWSPHTQMLNILVPVLCIWTLWMSWHDRLADRWYAPFFALFIGIGVAAYATFFVCLACMLAPWLVRQWLRGFPDGAARTAIRATMLTAIAVFPYLSWYLLVKTTTGSFYVHEAKFNQVIWIADAWRDGPLTVLSVWFSNASALATMALPQLASIVVAVGWTIVMLERGGKHGTFPAWRSSWQGIAFCALVAALFLAFYATVGFIRPRLAFGIVPPFIVGAGIFAVAALGRMSARDGKILCSGYLAVALAAAVFTVVKDGPWS